MSLYSDHFGTYCVCAPSEPGLPQLAPTASIGETGVTNVTAAWAWAAIPNATNYVLEISTSPSFATATVAYSGPLLGTTVIDLIPETTYYVRVKGQAAGYTDGPWVTDSAITEAVPLVTSLFGWADTNSVSSTLISAAQGSVEHESGATVIADFRANALPKWLYVLIPVDEPIRATWYGTALNNGDVSISDDSETFRYRGTVASGGDTYNVYMSTFETEQTDTVIEFRV
jgi:hypothetical protein